MGSYFLVLIFVHLYHFDHVDQRGHFAQRDHFDHRDHVDQRGHFDQRDHFGQPDHIGQHDQLDPLSLFLLFIVISILLALIDWKSFQSCFFLHLTSI